MGEYPLLYQESASKLSKNIKGFKVEWEAEGATLFDVVDLIRLSERHTLPVFVKISGYEAMRDLFDLYSLGVTHIIIPMIESAFGVKKALEAVDAVYSDTTLKITLTIESISGVEALPSILDAFHSRIERITIGRTDLSRSMGVEANDRSLLPILEQIINESKPYTIPIGIGGGISSNICQDRLFCQLFSFIETRHCIFDTNTLDPFHIEEALCFEQAWLEARIDRQSKQMRHYQNRLIVLKDRSHT